MVAYLNTQQGIYKIQLSATAHIENDIRFGQWHSHVVFTRADRPCKHHITGYECNCGNACASIPTTEHSELNLVFLLDKKPG